MWEVHESDWGNRSAEEDLKGRKRGGGGSDHGLWSERRRKRGLELGVNKIPIRGGCVGVEKLKSERGEQGIAIFAQI